jgi:hypothetical protein
MNIEPNIYVSIDSDGRGEGFGDVVILVIFVLLVELVFKPNQLNQSNQWNQ